jgi:hypothetical protein
MSSIKINQEQRVYVIPEGKGFTCLGFDVCEKITKDLDAELFRVYRTYKNTILSKQKYRKGTYKAYFRYCELVDLAHSINKANGYRFQCQLEHRLIGLEGRRIEVTTKDGEKRRFWVGRSTGFIPIHLEISRSNSFGGPSVCLFDTDKIRVL